MNNRSQAQYRAIVIGASLGGMEALAVLLNAIPASFPLPILIVHHVSPGGGHDLAGLLNSRAHIKVKEADDEEKIAGGTAYLAPADYHLLVERNNRLALSTDPPVNYARPSVDVLFESAADAFGPAVIGIILTGAGSDGAHGLKTIKEKGGIAVVQDPAEAVADDMPQAALAAVKADRVLPLKDIARFLCATGQRRTTAEMKTAGENRQ